LVNGFPIGRHEKRHEKSDQKKYFWDSLCRAAQDFRAEQQLCPARKVKIFVLRPPIQGKSFSG